MDWILSQLQLPLWSNSCDWLCVWCPRPGFYPFRRCAALRRRRNSWKSAKVQFMIKYKMRFKIKLDQLGFGFLCRCSLTIVWLWCLIQAWFLSVSACVAFIYFHQISASKHRDQLLRFWQWASRKNIWSVARHLSLLDALGNDAPCSTNPSSSYMKYD